MVDYGAKGYVKILFCCVLTTIMKGISNFLKPIIYKVSSEKLYIVANGYILNGNIKLK